ncbi:MAG TPA: hypothetical protein VF060_03235 [Trebonia sp.]
MAAAVFADEEPESLRRFPETGREELSRFFTLPRRTARSSTPPRALLPRLRYQGAQRKGEILM